MSIRQWKEKGPNLNCSISSIVNYCGQKYCQKIAKAYCFAMGFGDFGLEGVVLRNPLNLTFLLYYFHIRTILIPNEKAVQVFAKTACNCRLNTVTIMLLYSYGMNMLNLKR